MSSYDYNQLLKFLYFEGYADSYEEAEYILEEMTDEEFEELIEAKDIPQEVALKLADMLKGAPKFSRRGQTAQSLRQYAVERNKRRLAKMQQNEEKKPFPTEKVERQIDRHQSKASKSWQSRGGTSDPRKTSSYQARSRKMSAVASSVKRGEDPRNDSVQGDRRKIFTKEYGTHISAKTVDDSKSAYTPGGLRAHKTKAGGYRKLTRKEELEMQEAWYSGKGQYRTTTSGRKVRWDEDEATDDAVSAMMQKRREAAAKKVAQQRMKAKGTVPKKGGKDMFEANEKMKGEDPCWKGYEMVGTKKKGKKEVPNCVPKEEFEAIVEYLFVEGYADTIEGAELMAETISEEWVNEILDEKYVKAMDATGRGADRRAKSTDPTVRPRRLKPMHPNYKHMESGFDKVASRRSPSARKRKEERRQTVGGFD